MTDSKLWKKVAELKLLEWGIDYRQFAGMDDMMCVFEQKIAEERGWA